MAKRVAVIAGATGAASKRIVQRLLADPEWRVVGLSRNPRTSEDPRLVHDRCDLTDAASTKAALARHPDATHLFYTARITSSVVELRQAGFHDTIDTEAQILAHFARYREARILP